MVLSACPNVEVGKLVVHDIGSNLTAIFSIFFSKYEFRDDGKTKNRAAPGSARFLGGSCLALR